MVAQRTFRFANPELNAELASRLRTAQLRHSVTPDGTTSYAAADEERVENGILQEMRNQVFARWQLVFCPPDWADRYRQYMAIHRVPSEEQWADGQPCFLIPRQYRPHTWKLPEPPVATATLTPAHSR